MLKTDVKVAKENLLLATNYQLIAYALEMDASKFLYVLRNTEKGNYYRTFTIPKKSGGKRTINKPVKGLAMAQEHLSQILNLIYQPKDFVHGYVKDRSFLSNARYHEGAKWVLNLDIENFFGSITFPRVQGLFTSNLFGFNHDVATCLARICTYKDSLPQGAKTSPVIANLIGHNLDKHLVRIARDEKIRFTRYADDITFSSTKKSVPKSLVKAYSTDSGERELELASDIQNAFKTANFGVNEQKTRLQFPYERMEVTGLIVNKRANNWRRDISRLRMKLYSAKKFGDADAAKLWLHSKATSEDFWDHIDGWLGYIRQIRGKSDFVLAKLCKQAILSGGQNADWIREQAEMIEKYDVFLSHASEDKPKVLKLKDKLDAKGLSVFFDASEINWGDSIVEKVNHGLTSSLFFMPCLSSTFSHKGWTNKELNSAIQSQLTQRKKKILPIVLGQFEIGEKYPLLNDILYKRWPDDDEEQFLKEVAEEVAQLVQSSKLKT